jgi:hypothetical protein
MPITERRGGRGSYPSTLLIPWTWLVCRETDGLRVFWGLREVVVASLSLTSTTRTGPPLRPRIAGERVETSTPFDLSFGPRNGLLTGKTWGVRIFLLGLREERDGLDECLRDEYCRGGDGGSAPLAWRSRKARRFTPFPPCLYPRMACLQGKRHRGAISLFG